MKATCDECGLDQPVTPRSATTWHDKPRFLLAFVCEGCCADRLANPGAEVMR